MLCEPILEEKECWACDGTKEILDRDKQTGEWFYVECQACKNYVPQAW